MFLSHRGNRMAVARKIMFHGYEVSAEAHLAVGGRWVGRYRVAKDGRILLLRFNAVTRDTLEATAEAALVAGIQFVDKLQMLEHPL
jgi:hypothetical protein